MLMQVNLDETLHAQPEPRGVQASDISLNISICLETLATTPGLAGRQVQQVTQLMRCQLGIALQG